MLEQYSQMFQKSLFLFFFLFFFGLVVIIHNLAKFGYNQDMKIIIFNHPSILLATYWNPPNGFGAKFHTIVKFLECFVKKINDFFFNLPKFEKKSFFF
jgi:hypothetical protein